MPLPIIPFIGNALGVRQYVSDLVPSQYQGIANLLINPYGTISKALLNQMPGQAERLGDLEDFRDAWKGTLKELLSPGSTKTPEYPPEIYEMGPQLPFRESYYSPEELAQRDVFRQINQLPTVEDRIAALRGVPVTTADEFDQLPTELTFESTQPDINTGGIASLPMGNFEMPDLNFSLGDMSNFDVPNFDVPDFNDGNIDYGLEFARGGVAMPRQYSQGNWKLI